MKRRRALLSLINGKQITPSIPNNIPNNEIWYTSSDGNVVTPRYPDAFDAIIVSNTYVNGWGIISFDGPVTTIGEGAFRYCDSLTIVIIPNSVTTIESYAFADCTSLTNIIIPDSVTTIGYAAFIWCESLTSVTIPDGVTSIGNYTFEYCYSLTSVTIPDTVWKIYSAAFGDCISLTSVTIGDGVTQINKAAFSGCTSLISVYCKATTPPFLGNNDVFDNNASGRKIYVPAGSVNAYKSATRWSEYADAIEGYDFN